MITKTVASSCRLGQFLCLILISLIVSLMRPCSVEAQRGSRRAVKFDADGTLAKARELQRTGQREEAEQLVDRVLKRDKRNADALLQKGTLLLQRGDDVQAEEFYRRTIAVAPKYTDAYLGLSNVHIRRREPENAAYVLTWIPEDAVRGPEFLAQQGRVERAKGRFWKARQLFAKAKAEQPENSDYREARDETPMFFNTLSVENESFKRTGNTTVINNTLTVRPDRRVAVDVIGEQWIRDKGRGDPQRFGLGLALSPLDWFTVRGQFLESTEKAEVPSRYDLDVDIQVLPKPGTHLLAGVTRYETEPVNVNSQNLGVKQYLTDRLAVQAQRYWSKDTGNDAVGAETDVFRVIWEDPGVRNLALGYATGNEAFRVDNVTPLLPGRSYDFQSYFVTGRQWIGKNWGVLGGVALNERSNGNDSHTVSGGVFINF